MLLAMTTELAVHKILDLRDKLPVISYLIDAYSFASPSLPSRF
jgi:hypothetical protein